MAANSLSGNVTFSLSALEMCIIPLFQLNWPRETHFRHYLFIQKLNSGINPRWPPPLHWQFTFCIIRSMTFRYRYLHGTGIQLSKPTSDLTKAITFGGITLDSNIDQSRPIAYNSPNTIIFSKILVRLQVHQFPYIKTLTNLNWFACLIWCSGWQILPTRSQFQRFG